MDGETRARNGRTEWLCLTRRPNAPNLRSGGIFVGLLALILSGAAAAQDTGPATTQAAGEAGKLTEKVARTGAGGGAIGGMYEWLQMLLAMAVVVGLIFLARYLLRRLAAAGRGVPGFGAPGAAEIVSRTSAGMKHQLLVVRFGRRLVLIGVSGEGMRRLSEVTDAAEIDAILTTAGKGGKLEGGKA